MNVLIEYKELSRMDNPETHKTSHTRHRTKTNNAKTVH